MKSETALTSKQRKYLRGLAHNLDPVVMIGRGSVSDGVIAETRNALESHELIKVRIDADEGSDRREMAGELASRTDSELVGTIGKIAILYRRHPEEPKIRIP